MQQDSSRTKQILMIVDGYYPADIRVRKEAESLAKHFSVYVLCVKKDNELTTEIINKVTVLRKVNYKSFTEKGIVDIRLAINFIHPKFYKILPSVIEKYKINKLHVHDLPLAKTGYLIAKKYNLKSVLDLHENYAAALRTWFLWRKSFVIQLKNKIFFNHKRWQNYENKILKNFDHIIAVVEEMKARILLETKIDSNKITVITNSEKKSFADNFSEKKENFFVNYSDKFIISYVGGFGPHRGLQTAILGMKDLKEKIPNALLTLIGPANKDVKNYLFTLIKENKLEDHVKIFDVQPFDKVVAIMKSSHVNIIPHISNLHTESTIPHKLYQILLSRKPILVSSCAPLQRIIEDEDIGTVFKADSSVSFSDKVYHIYHNYKKAEFKASKGFQLAYDGELNWESTSKELIKLYQNI
jgi:glycosyltransferase involved in cell wall biosynthesis